MLVTCTSRYFSSFFTGIIPSARYLMNERAEVGYFLLVLPMSPAYTLRLMQLTLRACCCHPLPAVAPSAPPTMNVDVPRLLRVEYHKRMQAARMRRQHELENLLRSGKLPVGHCRVRFGPHAWDFRPKPPHSECPCCCYCRQQLSTPAHVSGLVPFASTLYNEASNSYALLSFPLGHAHAHKL